ncbi:hypothetical protein CYMTET_38973 [Cymbomonas tetramitiformis]|uniref:Uncharacterized protein n=1 Tax=Cymbomonas tetramitiformis TaxID=36881 RepID=A0AAE0CAY9_9CHLO|nr:hypothetical protein CYMTET_38973 [Cymbomonas tetramitiformis]
MKSFEMRQNTDLAVAVPESRSPMSTHTWKVQNSELPRFNVKEFFKTYLYESLPFVLAIPVCFAIERSLPYLQQRRHVFCRGFDNTATFILGAIHAAQWLVFSTMFYWLLTDQLQGLEMGKCLISVMFAQGRVFNIAAKYAYTDKTELERFYVFKAISQKCLADNIMIVIWYKPLEHAFVMRNLANQALEFSDVSLASFNFTIKDPDAADFLRHISRAEAAKDGSIVSIATPRNYHFQNIAWILIALANFKRLRHSAVLLDDLARHPGVPASRLASEHPPNSGPAANADQSEDAECVSAHALESPEPISETVDTEDRAGHALPNSQMVYIDLRYPENIYAWTKLHVALRNFAPQFQRRMNLFIGMYLFMSWGMASLPGAMYMLHYGHGFAWRRLRPTASHAASEVPTPQGNPHRRYPLPKTAYGGGIHSPRHSVCWRYPLRKTIQAGGALSPRHPTPEVPSPQGTTC